MASRKEPTLTAKLAACVRELLGIPWEHARLMTDDQVLSLVQWDHDPFYHSQHKHEPWVDEHWNLNPQPIRGHREKTAKVDVPQIAKTRRISTEQEAFRQRLLTPREERPVRKSRIQSRGFEKRKRK
jgi:hypothetical protein